MKLKRFNVFVFVLVFVSLFAFLLTGCDNAKFMVTFYNGEEVVHQEEVKKGKTVEEFALTLEGHEEVEWQLNGQKYDFSAPVTEDLNLYAYAELLKFTYVFKNDDGTVLKQTTDDYGATIVAPEDPTKPSENGKAFTFSGWDKPFDVLKADVTFTATYTDQDLPKVTYYGIDDQELESAFVDEEFALLDYKIPAGTDYRYIFLNWVDEDGNEVTNTTKFTVDTKLYPNYMKKRITLEGAKISIVGDSISTFYKEGSEYNSYYSDTNTFFYPVYSTTIKEASKTWWMQTITNTGTVLGINNSWSGTLTYNHGNENNSGAMNYGRLNTLNENGEPDIILVYMGTNDLGSSIDINTFKTAYTTMMNRLDDLYPEAIKFTFSIEYSILEAYKYEKRDEYNTFLRELALEKGYYMIETASIINEATYKKYLEDRLHPNYTGSTKMAELVAQTLKAYFDGTIDYVNIEYETDGGEMLDKVTYMLKGSTLEAITPATKEEYDFKGWYLDSDFTQEVTSLENVQEDVKLYAKFELSPKGVTFNLNGGTWDGSAAKYLTPTVELTVSDFDTDTFWTLYGSNIYLYTLDGGHRQNPTYSNRIEMHYDEASGLLVVDKNNKNGDTGVTYASEYIMVISAGYAGFNNMGIDSKVVPGMYVDLGVDPKTLEAGEVSLNAKFYAASELTSTIGRAFDTTDTLPTPVKDGATFAGWYKSADFSGEAVTTATEGDVVYAKWN